MPINDSKMDVYHELPREQKIIVQILSLVYKGCSHFDLINILCILPAKDDEKRPFTADKISEIIANLCEAELIDKNSHCHPEIAETILEDFVTNHNDHFNKATKIVSTMQFNHHFDEKWIWLIRLRISIYQLDEENFSNALSSLERLEPGYLRKQQLLSKVLNFPWRQEWFETLPLGIQAHMLDELIWQELDQLVKLDEILWHTLIEHKDSQEYGAIFCEKLAVAYLLRGEFLAALKLIDNSVDNNTCNAGLIQGSYLFLVDQNSQALIFFREALKQYRKQTSKKKIFFPHFMGMFFILALLKQGTPDVRQEIGEYIELVEQCNFTEYKASYTGFKAVLALLENETELAIEQYSCIDEQKKQSPLSMLFSYLCGLWINEKLVDVESIKSIFSQAATNGYQWVALQAGYILENMSKLNVEEREFLEKNRDDSLELPSVIDMKPEWQRTLEMLAETVQMPQESTKEQVELRVAWFIKYNSDGFKIVAKEQKLRTEGDWSKGREISFERLCKGDFTYFTPQDKNICKQIKKSSNVYFEETYDRFANWRKILLAMVAHPVVFWEESPEERVEIVQGKLEFVVEREGQQIHISLLEEITFNKDHDIIVYQDGANRIKIIPLSEQQQTMLNLIGKAGLKVPPQGEKQVLDCLDKLSSHVTIYSSLSKTSGTIEKIDVDKKLYIHLMPRGKIFNMQIWAKPCGEDGPLFKPGTGKVSVVAEIEGKTVQTQRNLKVERELAWEILESCSFLGEEGYENWQWSLSLEECLTTLMELRQLENVKICWPEGKKIQLLEPLSLQQMRVKIKKERDWFSLDGDIKLDESKVIGLKKLLALLEMNSWRFITLAEGEYALLTEQMRKQLQDIKMLTEETAEGMRIHPFAAPAIEELAYRAGEVDTGEEWQNHLQKFDMAQTIDPRIPSTLQAELRSYQVEGFQWLYRLAYWGSGACLADDMGLGKTLQALAIILQRTIDGPTLVIAPTSVCMNWIAEMRRFAPTLNPVILKSRGRAEQFAKLKPFDVLVTSYGLLQREGERFGQVKWHTIVLDEAQAIKNRKTNRSRIAMSLQGNFKIITTGTPIENNLGELWNLFRFINPGLLGSYDKFNKKFAIAIERDHNLEVQKRLKKLLQPFIMRRTKSEVLDELPPRTEVNLYVELTKKEMTFYEALRQRTVEKLVSQTSSDGDEKSQGQQRIIILAEIMKLRRACCHHRLIAPELELENSKLILFQQIVQELLANNHKALVFSQFVDYLKIIREFLDAERINYQYLDGSTPMKKRQQIVDNFQSGEGDIFLISLKAGGVGLNLTAADYVIHMDPWWNPAVEDQATDRAYRIGQKRPVTVYRLVTRYTIEEKILTLHKEKRDLATGLLSGEVTGKISTDELLQLISESE